MALGEMYRPKGLALETARAVLEVEDPFGCNVAMGCPGDCRYCYGSKAFKKKDWTKVRYPKRTALESVRKQLNKGLKPQGVFVSFSTDPFHDRVRRITEQMMYLLEAHKIKTATLTKLVSSTLPEGHRYGITVVSISEKFWKEWEPNAINPIHRINDLAIMAYDDDYCWDSMEPYPVPAIFEQDLIKVLEKIKFMKFIIFGKWNYDQRANTDDAREFYYRTVLEFRDWCKSNNIRYHVKSGTLRFVGLEHDIHFQGHGGIP